MRTAAYKDRDTHERDASLLRNHILPPFGKRTVARTTTKDLREWVVALPLGRASASLCKQLLARIFDQAVEDGVITRSLMTKSVRVPPTTRSKRADRWLTVPEVKSLANAIERRCRALVLMMGYMGLRFGEAAGLTMKYLDLLHGTAEIALSLSETRAYLNSSIRRPRRRIARFPCRRSWSKNSVPT